MRASGDLANLEPTPPEVPPKQEARLIALVTRELHDWLTERATHVGFRSTAAYVRALLEAHRASVAGATAPGPQTQTESD